MDDRIDFGVDYREELASCRCLNIVNQLSRMYSRVARAGKLLATSREILAYSGTARFLREESLIPDSDAEDVYALIKQFYWTTGMAVRRWAYITCYE